MIERALVYLVSAVVGVFGVVFVSGQVSDGFCSEPTAATASAPAGCAPGAEVDVVGEIDGVRAAFNQLTAR